MLMQMNRKVQKKARKNIVITAIGVGNLPLQGTKAFVIIAINLSLGESIPTPYNSGGIAAEPMHGQCLFPMGASLLKEIIRLNAILGK